MAYFTNDIDTETSGVDLVATYSVDWSGGNTTLSLAGNVNQTKVTRRTDRQTDPTDPNPIYFVNDTDVFQIEESDPAYRVVFTARHRWDNNVSASVRGSGYGDYQLIDFFTNQTAKMRGKVFWDADITWDVSDALSVTFGGNNIFNEFPDLVPNLGFIGCCGVVYDVSSVMDWQGSYYFVRGVLRWN